MVRITFSQEKRIQLVTGGFTVLGIILMLVVISTDYWVILTIPTGKYRARTQTIVMGHHSGLWRICVNEIDNKTVPHVESKYTSNAVCYYVCNFLIGTVT